jgi:putative hydrolase of the HAD superfamily
MSANAAPQVVCFDLGRVLVRLVDGWTHACQLAGVPGDSARWPAEARRQVTHISEQYELGRLDCQEFQRRVSAILDCPQEHIAAVYDQWLQGLFPGVESLIEELHDRGLATACLSNTNARHWALMMDHPTYQPLRRLRHRHASHLMGVAKPDPDIYRRFEQSVGARGPVILYFDDLPDNVAAAASRDWSAHRIDPAADPLKQIRGVLRKAGVFSA